MFVFAGNAADPFFFFRSHAMMKESMIVSVVINIVNVGGNLVLINGRFGLPALGVVGAAISSNLSRIAGLAIMFWIFYKKLGARFSLRYPAPISQKHAAATAAYWIALWRRIAVL